ncbi:MAG: hypothetical protein M3Q45_02190, partial [Chloroflexota bacterium]|nr:hypothetical protein [Chloroflexota bacterium]
AMRNMVSGYQTQAQATLGEQQRQQWQQRWASQLQRWDGEIRDLNKRINTLNLQLPIARLEIYKLLLDDELRRVGMTRTL